MIFTDSLKAVIFCSKKIKITEVKKLYLYSQFKLTRMKPAIAYYYANRLIRPSVCRGRQAAQLGEMVVIPVHLPKKTCTYLP